MHRLIVVFETLTVVGRDRCEQFDLTPSLDPRISFSCQIKDPDSVENEAGYDADERSIYLGFGIVPSTTDVNLGLTIENDSLPTSWILGLNVVIINLIERSNVMSTEFNLIFSETIN